MNSGMAMQLSALQQQQHFNHSKQKLMGPHGDIDMTGYYFNHRESAWIEIKTGKMYLSEDFIQKQIDDQKNNEIFYGTDKDQKMTVGEIMDKIEWEKKWEKQKSKETTMFGEFKNDVKTFMREHKGLIYGIFGLYLLDHFVLEGKLKAKLLELAHKLIGKLETKVDAIGTSTIEQK